VRRPGRQTRVLQEVNLRLVEAANLGEFRKVINTRELYFFGHLIFTYLLGTYCAIVVMNLE